MLRGARATVKMALYGSLDGLVLRVVLKTHPPPKNRQPRLLTKFTGNRGPNQYSVVFVPAGDSNQTSRWNWNHASHTSLLPKRVFRINSPERPAEHV